MGDVSDQEKMREMRDLAYKNADKGIPLPWRDIGPDELWEMAWQASSTQANAAHKEEIAKWVALVTTSEQIVILKNKQLVATQLCIEQMREALKAIIKVHGYESGIPVDAVSLQPSLSALREHDAKVLEPLQKQVVVMHTAIEEGEDFIVENYSVRAIPLEIALTILTNSKSSAEAYDREQAARVLESVFQERELRKLTTADTVAEMIKELRAQSTQKKEDE